MSWQYKQRRALVVGSLSIAMGLMVVTFLTTPALSQFQGALRQGSTLV